jgi:oligopeptide transport system substrate-binding protein
MSRYHSNQSYLGFVVAVLCLISIGCGTSASSRYWGRTTAPTDNILRYVTGSEPESLDPQLGIGQPEARIYMALYDGLVEYEPKTMDPIPAIAEKWETSSNGLQYVFHLRKNAKFSDGKPITANDVVYTYRRGFVPDNAFRNASLGYYIKYAEGFNSGSFFLKTDGKFVLDSEIAEAKEGESAPPKAAVATQFGADTEFQKYITSELRLIVVSDLLKRGQDIEKNPKLKRHFQFDGKSIKDAKSLVAKISGGGAFADLLKTQVGAETLSACAADCSDDAKQKIADALNKASDGDLLKSEGVTISDDTKGLLKQITDENKKRADANAEIEKAVAEIQEPEKKAEKVKQKKNPIAKLFYANRSLVQDFAGETITAPELVAIKGEDLGVEAVDDYTFRITLNQPAPYFIGLLAHQFFRIVPQQTIEKFGKEWVKPNNIVTSGAFKVKEHSPYHQLIVERDPNYWDAKTVQLDGIEFYPSEEHTTVLNLYKSGKIDAFYNHTVPAAWIDDIKKYKDEYLDFPEVAIEMYTINTKKPPMDNVKVREAFNLAYDRDAYAQYKKVVKPLYYLSPQIFPEYEKAKSKVAAEIAKEKGITTEQLLGRYKFNPKRACDLMKEAGYKVTPGENGKCSVENFPVDKVNITYNTQESNKNAAEFCQAQWKQNMGITIPLKNMEWKTFLPTIQKLDFEGFARKGWVGDYMDPFTFLDLYYKGVGNSNNGWQDDKYDAMLDDANNTVDATLRLEKLAWAEFYALDQNIMFLMITNATNWMKKPYVKRLYPNPGTLHAWKYVYIEKDPAKWDQDVNNIFNDGFEAFKKAE